MDMDETLLLYDHSCMSNLIGLLSCNILLYCADCMVQSGRHGNRKSIFSNLALACLGLVCKATDS